MFSKLFNILKNPNFRVIYIFARFKILRSLSKYLKLFLKKISSENIRMGPIKKKKLVLIRHKPIASSKNYVEINKSNNEILNQLKLNGLHEGLYLKKDVVKDLMSLSSKCELTHARNNKIFNNLEEVNIFNTNNKNPCTIVDLINDNENQISDLDILIDEIARDKNLLSIANNYLGNVNKIYTKFTWSTVCDSDTNWRKNEQTIEFHYDVHDFGFVYVFFYLTDCNKLSGAHEVILGSHNRKKISHLIGSARSMEKELKEYYGETNFKTIEGSSGYGFIEDTSTFHKAHAPIIKPRLALQIRYH